MRGFFCCVVLLLAAAVSVSGQDQPSDSVGGSGYRYFDTPVDADKYLIRPGDILTITFIGAQLPTLTLPVDPEGQIVHSVLGVFDMRGRTLAGARVELGEALKRLYNVERIVISIGKPRLVGIRVSGSVDRPGLYTLYTSQRASEAVDSAGGVTPEASRRNIRLTGGPSAVPVDLDRARYSGEPEWDPAVYAGQTVVVPVKSNRIVNVVGEVVRPREIEYVEGETVAAVLMLAGGLEPTADPAGIVVIRGAEKIPADGAQLQPGDIVFVPMARAAAEDAPVTIFGAVTQPGHYRVAEGETLEQMIKRAGGFTAKAAPMELTVFRKVPLEAVMRSGERFAIANLVTSAETITEFNLQAGDSIFVPIAVGYVRVSGEVYNPGMFPYAAGRSVSDYVKLAGGFLSTADNGIVEVFHRVSRATIQTPVEVQVHDGDEITVLRREELR